MNITFLLRLWPVYGGGETVTICLANEMIKRGWNVSVLYFKNNTRADLPFIDPAIKAVQIPDIRCDEFTTRFPDADKDHHMSPSGTLYPNDRGNGNKRIPEKKMHFAV